MKNITAAITIIFFILSACKKSQVSPKPAHISFGQDALDWAFIPVNRQFVYKDSATGKEDVVTCIASNTYYDFYPANAGLGSSPAYYYEVYDLELKIKGLMFDWFTGQATAGSPYNHGRDYDSSWIAFCGGDTYLPNESICGIGFAFRADSSNYLDTMRVNGTTYHEVIYTDCTDGAASDTAQSWYFANRYYWAKGIGVIKRQVRTNTGSFSQVLESYAN